MPPFCSQCGIALAPDARFCEECGAEVSGKAPSGIPYLRTPLLVGLSLATVLGIGALFLFVGDSSDITKEEGEGKKSNMPRDVPASVKKLVFDGPAFTAPITLDLPREDSGEQLTEIRNTVYGLAPIRWTPGFDNIDKGLLSFLIKNNFARVETATVQSRYFSGDKSNGWAVEVI